MPEPTLDRSRRFVLPAPVRRWLLRYLPSELMGTLLASLCAFAATRAIGSDVAAAFAFTWGENLAYYGVMLGRDLAARRGRAPLRVIVRDLVLEFGPAEALDSFLLRPACLLAGLALAPNAAIGLVAGKLAADVAFYLPTVAMHELLRRFRTQAAQLLFAIAVPVALASDAAAQALDVGSPVFEYELRTSDGAIVAGDGHQHPGPIDASYAFPNHGTNPFERKLQAFSNAGATTFWVTATSANTFDPNGVVGGTSRLSFYQSFRKLDPAATLAFKTTKLLIEARHVGNPGATESLEAEVSVDVKAYTGARILDQFHGVAYLRGRVGAWEADALGDWEADLDVAIGGPDASRHSLELQTTYPIEIDLSNVGLDDDGDGTISDAERTFTVRYDLEATAFDDLQEEVDWIRAYLRDPADVGGDGFEIEFTGLVATDAPLLAAPFEGLAGRDLDGVAETIEAFYDPALDVTWLADANLAASESFGVAGIGAGGGMDRPTAQAWIAALNAAEHGGFDDWRLPATGPANGVAHIVQNRNDGASDLGYGVGAPGTLFAGATGSEMAHLFYTTLGNGPALDAGGVANACLSAPDACLTEAGPFAFGDVSSAIYWSGDVVTNEPAFDGLVYTFDFATGFQGIFDAGVTNLRAWPVRNGDTLPVPEATSGAALCASLATLLALHFRRSERSERAGWRRQAPTSSP